MTYVHDRQINRILSFHLITLTLVTFPNSFKLVLKHKFSFYMLKLSSNLAPHDIYIFYSVMVLPSEICVVIAYYTTSGSFAGLGFLAWYLAGKIAAFDRKGHIAKLCIVFLPLLTAALVAVSRVDDYWHHWQDVFAGALIGL